MMKEPCSRMHRSSFEPFLTTGNTSTRLLDSGVYGSALPLSMFCMSHDTAEKRTISELFVGCHFKDLLFVSSTRTWHVSEVSLRQNETCSLRKSIHLDLCLGRSTHRTGK